LLMAIELGATKTQIVKSQCIRTDDTSYQFDEIVGEYLRAISKNWLIGLPEKNPALLEMFADRDKEPTRNLVPWSGEFAGKYLTGAVQVLRLTQDKELEQYLTDFVNKLVQLQTPEGYLGPWPKGYQLTGDAPNLSRYMASRGTWDAWNHYHIMMGLLLWYDQTGDKKALEATVKIADLMCDLFLGKPGVMAKAGNEPDKNLAPIHTLCLLYAVTGTTRYLDLARQIVEQEIPMTGDYVRLALSGKDFCQMPLPRWESLHTVMGILEMYRVTGEEKYRKTFERIWWNIVEQDRHNTGAYSTDEMAVGNPYAIGAIETCCVIGWSALSVEMMKLTGNSIVADELELTLMNAIQGYQDLSGKWCAYHTPMDGRRVPSTTSISFQTKRGGKDLNCCSVNSPRGFGLLSEWALMKDNDGLILNWYGPCEINTKHQSTAIRLKQETDYPKTGIIVVHVTPEDECEFTLKLRIPYWSENTFVSVNGASKIKAIPGSYLALKRRWKRQDRVDIELDMSPHFWVGEREYAGKTSIYRGPILLAYDNKNPLLRLSPEWNWYGKTCACKNIGATIRYEFEGDHVEWLGNTFDNAGIALVKIDGKEVARVDQYKSGQSEPFHWKYDMLEPGTHTLEIGVTDKKHKESRDIWINCTEFLPASNESIFDAKTIAPQFINAIKDEKSFVALECKDVAGRKIILRDFDSAGRNNSNYISWLKVNNIKKTPFSRTNPLRSGRSRE